MLILDLIFDCIQECWEKFYPQTMGFIIICTTAVFAYITWLVYSAFTVDKPRKDDK